jgi:hypothetical protein
LTVLERTTWLALPVVGLAGLAFARRAMRLRLLAVYLLGLALLPAPWVARSLRLYGDLTLNSVSAELLWRGNNPLATGGSFAPGGRVSVFEAAPEDFRRKVRAADELTQRRLFTEAAREYVRDHPGEALERYAHKVVGFWWFMPHSGLLYPAAYLVVYKAYYTVVLLLAGVGIAGIIARGDTDQRWILTAAGVVLLVTSVAQAVFYVEIRHRWSVEPILLVLAAAGVIRPGRRWLLRAQPA